MCTIYFICEIMGYLLETTVIICSKSVNVNINSLVVSEKNYQNTILLCNIEKASACNLQNWKILLKKQKQKWKKGTQNREKNIFENEKWKQSYLRRIRLTCLKGIVHPVHTYKVMTITISSNNWKIHFHTNWS